jgi:outer membrane lipopolysaccharide assembly protein LptE/RlpB
MPFLFMKDYMNKLLLVLMLMSLSGCANLLKGAEQPVMQFRDAKTFKTTCSGAVEDWGSCHRKANRTCANGYTVDEKKEDSYGLIRSMVFICK